MSSEKTLSAIIFLNFFWASCWLAGPVFSQGYEDKSLAADKAFSEKRFMEAMEIYDSLFEEGQYSEAMLYRMAFIHEETKNYPMAIFYLKKAAKEFGNPAIDAKVKQVMQLQGSDRFFPSSAWNTYLQFFRSWGWLLWGLFAAGILVVVLDSFVGFQKGASWRKGTVAGAWTVVVLLAVALGHRSFMVPELAVLVEPTSFYDFPSYAGKQIPKAFSPGETVSINDSEDIWVLVQAGDREYWVPKRTVKLL